MTDSIEEESKHLRELLAEALREVERLKEWQHGAAHMMRELNEELIKKGLVSQRLAQLLAKQ